MSKSIAFKVSPISGNELEDVSRLVADVIQPLEYYNERARSEEIAKYGPTQLQAMSKEDPDSVLVARSGNSVAGFCLSRYDDGLVWLSWFGVAPDFRENGVGEALLRALASTLSRRRAHKVWCDTRTSNVRSQRLLQRVGFVQLAELKNHWYGQDFFLWEWYPG